jgi:hypothetical protein
MQRKLCERLEAVAAHLRTAEEVSADEFLRIIEVMTMMEKYFTPEQLQLIHEARQQVGLAWAQQKQEEWAEVIALLRTEMEKGTDLTQSRVQALAKRFMDLLNECTGGDRGIQQSMKRLWEEQGDVLAAQHGSQYDSRPVWAYLNEAIAAAEGSA